MSSEIRHSLNSHANTHSLTPQKWQVCILLTGYRQRGIGWVILELNLFIRHVARPSAIIDGARLDSNGGNSAQSFPKSICGVVLSRSHKK